MITLAVRYMCLLAGLEMVGLEVVLLGILLAFHLPSVSSTTLSKPGPFTSAVTLTETMTDTGISSAFEAIMIQPAYWG